MLAYTPAPARFMIEKTRPAFLFFYFGKNKNDMGRLMQSGPVDFSQLIRHFLNVKQSNQKVGKYHVVLLQLK